MKNIRGNFNSDIQKNYCGGLTNNFRLSDVFQMVLLPSKQIDN